MLTPDPVRTPKERARKRKGGVVVLAQSWAAPVRWKPQADFGASCQVPSGLCLLPSPTPRQKPPDAL